MNNNELADVFEKIASLMEIKGEVIYKTLAYRRAAESLRVLPGDISSYWKEERLTEIPGVGKAIAEKISELLQTGELDFMNKLEQECPQLLEWLQVRISAEERPFSGNRQGEDPVELKRQRNGKLKTLPGMGEKSEGPDHCRNRSPLAPQQTHAAGKCLVNCQPLPGGTPQPAGCGKG